MSTNKHHRQCGYSNDIHKRQTARFEEEPLLSRRRFLTLAGGVALAAPTLGVGLADAAPQSGAPQLAMVKGAPDAATRVAVEALGGMAAFVQPGDKVVIKPNMSFADTPDRATNTHPLVVRELMQLCLDAGASKVLVLDHTLADAEQCMQRSGIRAACEALQPGAVHVLTRNRFYEKVNVPGGRGLKHTEVMTDVLEADVLISAAKAKSHSGAGVSMSMKNLMGLVYDRGAFHRRGLHECIVDLTALLRPALAVVDATTILSTGGPFGPGEVQTRDLVIASPDPVAADAQAVKEGQWYGRQIIPEQIRYLRLAHERGVGRIDVDALRTVRLEA